MEIDNTGKMWENDISWAFLRNEENKSILNLLQDTNTPFKIKYLRFQVFVKLMFSY